MSIAARKVQVAGSAVRIDNATASGRQTGQSIAVLNDGDDTVYLGGPDVTVADGYPLPAGAQVALDLQQTDAIFAVADGSTTLRLLDTSV